MLVNHIFQTPIGNLNVLFDEHVIYRSYFTDETSCKTPSAGTPFFSLISQQLDRYFTDCTYRFDLAYCVKGSCHQTKVWQALNDIPAGKIKTYQELAQELNSCAQAIGQACKRNPIALFIPCHRVIGKNNYGGFMGQKYALKYKIGLLKHERYLD